MEELKRVNTENRNLLEMLAKGGVQQLKSQVDDKSEADNKVQTTFWSCVA